MKYKLFSYVGYVDSYCVMKGEKNKVNINVGYNVQNRTPPTCEF